MVDRSRTRQKIFPVKALIQAIIRVVRENAGQRSFLEYVTKVSYAVDLWLYQQNATNLFMNIIIDYGVYRRSDHSAEFSNSCIAP